MSAPIKKYFHLLCGIAQRHLPAFAALFLIPLGTAAEAQAEQGFGACEWRLTGDLYYYESFRSLGNEGGLYATVSHVGSAAGYVFGYFSSDHRQDLSISEVPAYLWELWLFPQGAWNDRVERFDDHGAWIARLGDLGIPPGSRVRGVDTFQSTGERFLCGAEELTATSVYWLFIAVVYSWPAPLILVLLLLGVWFWRRRGNSLKQAIH